jgi:proton glutamate symport protein
LQDLLQRIEPIGTVFIRLIMMIVIPLVVASLILGTASLGDIRKLGRLGGKTVAFYLFTTAIAVSIGLLLSNIVRPGSRIDPTTRDTIAASFSRTPRGRMTLAAEAPTVGETLLNMIPTNPFQSAANGELLPLIIFSIIFGAAVSLVARERRDAILTSSTASTTPS